MFKFWGITKDGRKVDLGRNLIAAPRLARANGVVEAFGFNPSNGVTFII